MRKWENEEMGKLMTTWISDYRESPVVHELDYVLACDGF